MTPDWLTSLDDGFTVGRVATSGKEGRAATGSPADFSSLAATADIPNGFYTLTLPDGGHRTFRVHTRHPNAKFAPGQRVIGLLIGPDNTSDYEGVAFLAAGGIQIWKRHRGGKTEVWLGVLWELMRGGHVDGCELLVSKRCLVCNRTLTDDESIARGIGPTCWERMNHG